MVAQAYQRLIIKGIKGLPSETLAEIVHFVYFVRKRALYPQAFEQELHNALLEAELGQLSRNQETHLEQEFEGYDQLYPFVRGEK